MCHMGTYSNLRLEVLSPLAAKKNSRIWAVTPLERSTGNTAKAGRAGSSQHKIKNEKAEVRGARSHSRHWKPGARRPLVPTAWLSPLHSRPVQTHQATTAAELRRGRRRAEMSNTISTSYINIALCSRVTPFGRRGLSAPSSRFFDGSATSFRRLCRPVL